MKNPELEAIDGLAKVVSAYYSAVAIQLVEIQAMVNVLLDLEPDRLKREGHDPVAIAQLVEASFQAHRQSVYSVVQDRLRLANPDIDLGPSH
jgi:hypothetical protein